MTSTTTTIASTAAGHVLLDQRLVRRGAAAPAEALAGCMRLDADAIRRLRGLAIRANVAAAARAKRSRVDAARRGYGALLAA